MATTSALARVTLAAAFSVALAAPPALAQVQQGNPNAANQSLSTMGTTRTMQQGATSQTDTRMMDAGRSRAAPAAPTAPAPIPRAGTPAR